MGRKAEDLTGQKFGRLTVIKRVEDHICQPSGYRVPQWLCECSCDNHALVTVTSKNLKNKNVQSCGCLKREKDGQHLRKYNLYDMDSFEYGIGYTSNTNKEFWFDKEDFDLIKDCCWMESDKGYITTYKTINGVRELILLHRLVTNAPDDVLVDHKNHRKFDNRKSELRFVNNQQNSQNSLLSKNNTSGYSGVTWHSRDKVWQARIKVNYKYIHLGCFNTKEEAIAARKEAEEKYFGEYSYNNSIDRKVN